MSDTLGISPATQYYYGDIWSDARGYASGNRNHMVVVDAVSSLGQVYGMGVEGMVGRVKIQCGPKKILVDCDKMTTGRGLEGSEAYLSLNSIDALILFDYGQVRVSQRLELDLKM